jgi:hypothetical protein
MEKFLSLKVGSNKKISIKENTLLVFIDETGEAKLRDLKFPVFGLGGCAVFSQDYYHMIHVPWTIMQKKFNKKILHASEIDLKNEPKENIMLMGSYFKNGEFKRFAFTVSNDTLLSEGWNYYKILSILLSNYIINISYQYPWITDIAMIFENSSEGNKNINKYFRKMDYKKLGIKVNIENYVAKKGIIKGLEVADFIIQAAGTQTRNGIGIKNNFRKDFSSIFIECDNDLQKFIAVNKV